MGDTGQTVTVEQGGWSVESNSATSEEQLSEAVAQQTPKEDKKDEEKPDLSRAASELGKKGGEASAEKRKAEKSVDVESTEKVEEKPEKVEEERDAASPDETEEEKRYREEGERRKKDARERVIRATQKEAQAKRDLAAAEQALAESRSKVSAYEARLQALEQAAGFKPQEETSGPQKPRMEDYGEDADRYLDDLLAYNNANLVRQVLAEIGKRDTVMAQDNALASQIAKFRDAALSPEFMEEYSDQVLGARPTFQLEKKEQPTGETWIADWWISSPETARSLMLYFSGHPDEFQRIAALKTEHAVSRALARLEIRLDAASTGVQESGEQSEVSTAPPPIKPVKGTPSIADVDEYRPGMTLDEYKKVWDKKIKPRLR